MSGRALSLVVGLVLAGIGPVAHGASKSSGSTTYRWVDKQGVVHYGDRIPPEYAQQESAVLNVQGVEVERRAAPKTPEELAEEARKQKLALEREQHDNFLLTTYTSVKDIEMLRDTRVEQIKAQRTVAEQQLANSLERLTVLQTRAMKYKPYSSEPNAKRMPDALAEDLARVVNDVRNQQNVIAAKGEEEEKLRAQFQADIDRYRELRNPKAAVSQR